MLEDDSIENVDLENNQFSTTILIIKYDFKLGIQNITGIKQTYVEIIELLGWKYNPSKNWQMILYMLGRM